MYNDDKEYSRTLLIRTFVIGTLDNPNAFVMKNFKF